MVAALLGHARTAAGWADTAAPLDVSWPLGLQLRGVAAIPRIAAAFSRDDTFAPASRPHCTVGQSPKGMMVFIYIGHLSGLQGVEMCAGLLQSVPMGAAECVQGYRVCAGCSFNNLPCSSRLNQKIFY